MKKFIKKLRAIKVSTWLWWGLIVLLFASAIVGLTIYFNANGWTWMIVFGNTWFWFILGSALIVAVVMFFFYLKSKLTKI